MNKKIEVRQFNKFWNIAIWNGFFPTPRIRHASSKSSLNRILREEDISWHPQFGKIVTEVIHLDERGK